MSAPIGRRELRDIARTHRLVPLTRTLFADAETPVGVYRKLAADRPGTFLLESAEPGRSFSRWSFVGVNAVATLSARAGEAVWSGQVPDGVPTDGDPLEVLGAAWRALRGPRLPGLPPLTGGFVGYLAYDVVRRIETSAPEGRGRPGPSRADHAARHRPGGRGPPRVLRDAHRERGGARRDVSRRARCGLRRRLPPVGCRCRRRSLLRPRRPWPRSASPNPSRQCPARRRGSTNLPWSRRSRPCGPARSSRFRLVSGSRSTRTRTHSTSIGCCAP